MVEQTERYTVYFDEELELDADEITEILTPQVEEIFNLQTTTPRYNQILTSPPAQVTLQLEFDEEVDKETLKSYEYELSTIDQVHNARLK